MNSLISYPRSGRTLTEQRMRLIVYLLTKDDSPKALDKYIHLSHGGFDVRFGSQPDGLQSRDNSQGTTYFLLRNAKGVVNSFYYQTVFSRQDILRKQGLFDGIPEQMSPFVKGSWGLERYSRYLEAIERYRKETKRSIKFLFYEDLVSKEVIPELVKVLSFPSGIKLTQDEVDFIYDNTLLENVRSGNVSTDAGKVRNWILRAVSLDGKRENSCARVGTPENYKKTLPRKLQKYIDNYLREHCVLSFYRDKYIK